MELMAVMGDWTLNSMLGGAGQVLNYWGGLILIVLGMAALIVAAYKIVSGLISHGKAQTSWGVVIILLIVGGVFVAVGVQSGIAGSFLGNMAVGTGNSLNEIGNGDGSYYQRGGTILAGLLGL